MIAGSSLCFLVIWFFRKVKYSFVVFSIVSSLLSAVNLKCINCSLIRFYLWLNIYIFEMWWWWGKTIEMWCLGWWSENNRNVVVEDKGNSKKSFSGRKSQFAFILLTMYNFRAKNQWSGTMTISCLQWTMTAARNWSFMVTLRLSDFNSQAYSFDNMNHPMKFFLASSRPIKNQD